MDRQKLEVGVCKRNGMKVTQKVASLWKDMSKGMQGLVIGLLAILLLMVIYMCLPQRYQNSWNRIWEQRRFDIAMEAWEAGDYEKATKYITQAGAMREAGEVYLNYRTMNQQGATIEEWLQLFREFEDEYTEENAGDYAGLLNETRDICINWYLADHMPYEGMPVKYINTTSEGAYDICKSKKVGFYDEMEYWWYGEDSSYPRMIVCARDGKVKYTTSYTKESWNKHLESLKRLREYEQLSEEEKEERAQERKDQEWKRKRQAMWKEFREKEEQKKRTKKQQTKTEEIEDAFDGRDYDNPEDFFLVTEGEFDNYDEAADYYFDVNDE